MGALAKVRYQPSTLAWAIDTKTLKVSYFARDCELSLDPQRWIVGVFLQEE